MTYDARQIANWFIVNAGKENQKLTIMAILKLIYISHGWYLALYNQPLFYNRIEAWKFGPVVPDVYLGFRNQGMQIDKPLQIESDKIGTAEEKFLTEIYEIYGDLNPYHLSKLTHVPGGPWEITMRIGGLFSEIPNDLIKQHYVIKKQKADQDLE